MKKHFYNKSAVDALFDAETTEKFIEKNSFEISNANGMLALLQFCKEESYDVFRQMLKHIKFDAEAINFYKPTPNAQPPVLLLFTKLGWLDEVKFVLSQGADILITDLEGKTVFDYALEYNSLQIFDYLMNILRDKLIKGLKNEDAIRFLRHVSQFFRNEIDSELYSFHIDTTKGWEVLRMAMVNKQNIPFNVLRISADFINYQWNQFLPNQTSVGFKPNLDYTLLMIAAGNGLTEQVKVLLQQKASPMIASLDGRNALDLAVEFGHTEIITLLSGFGRKNRQATNKLLDKLGVEKKTRKIAIGDIHGHLKTLKALLHTTLKITKDDEVYLLGDYFDRGTDALGVIDHIVDLQSKGYKITPLMGNHEEMQLISRLEGSKALPEKYADFVRKLPYYAVVDNFILSHAGVNLKAPNIFKDTFSLVWIRYWESAELLDRPDLADDTNFIYGHTPRARKFIQNAIENRSRFLPLDNAVFLHSDPRYGNLVAFDFANWEVHFQENVEYKGRLIDAIF